MADTNKLSIVYNSGLAIQDKSHLSTLAIFYDQIVLPAETARQTMAVILYKGYPTWRVQEAYWSNKSSGEAFDEGLKTWERANKPLLDEGVISRLNSPDISVMRTESANFSRLLNHINYVSRQPNPHLDPYYSSLSKFLGTDANSVPANRLVYTDMHFHRIRHDVEFPGVFSVPKNSSAREIYKTSLAHSALKYMMPKISELEPEEILEIRREVADNREGFSMHLQSLSESVEERIKGGETLSEIAKFAQSINETRLFPDYHEFNRILEATEKRRRRGKILDIAGRFFEIDAVFGSPKFFAQLFRAIGDSLNTDAEEQASQLTNRNQAYHFMRIVEKHQSE